jgi:hypothetical protein
VLHGPLRERRVRRDRERNLQGRRRDLRSIVDLLLGPLRVGQVHREHGASACAAAAGGLVRGQGLWPGRVLRGSSFLYVGVERRQRVQVPSDVRDARHRLQGDGRLLLGAHLPRRRVR